MRGKELVIYEDRDKGRSHIGQSMGYKNKLKSKGPQSTKSTWVNRGKENVKPMDEGNQEIAKLGC